MALDDVQAGHTGWNQGELAAQNILKQVRKDAGETDDVELEKYVISPPQIKLTLGLVSLLPRVPHASPAASASR